MFQSIIRPQRGEGLAVGLTEGLGVGLGIGLTDAPAFGTIGVGLVIGVGEMPGELFRIGLLLGSGLVLGTVCPPMLPPGCIVPAGLVVVPPWPVAPPGCVLPVFVLVCAEINDGAAMHATMMPNNLIRFI